MKFKFKNGYIGEVPDTIALTFEKRGQGEIVKDVKPEVKAIQPEMTEKKETPAVKNFVAGKGKK